MGLPFGFFFFSYFRIFVYSYLFLLLFLTLFHNYTYKSWHLALLRLEIPLPPRPPREELHSTTAVWLYGCMAAELYTGSSTTSESYPTRQVDQSGQSRKQNQPWYTLRGAMLNVFGSRGSTTQPRPRVSQWVHRWSRWKGRGLRGDGSVWTFFFFLFLVRGAQDENKNGIKGSTIPNWLARSGNSTSPIHVCVVSWTTSTQHDIPIIQIQHAYSVLCIWFWADIIRRLRGAFMLCLCDARAGSERSCLPRGNASSCSSVSIVEAVNRPIPPRIHLSVPRLDIALEGSMVKFTLLEWTIASHYPKLSRVIHIHPVNPLVHVSNMPCNYCKL